MAARLGSRAEDTAAWILVMDTPMQEVSAARLDRAALRMHVFSDVHLEFGNFRPKPTGANVIVAAGDTGPGLAGADWLMRTFAPTPVIYVIGNHEPYNRVLEHFENDLKRKCAGTNVMFCKHPGRRIDIGNVRFLGTTLWTDFNLYGDPQTAMKLAMAEMTDYSVIRVASLARRYSGVPLRPAHILDRHREALAWLDGELARPWPGKTVLVTHHSPTASTVEYPGDVLNTCYASRLEALLDGGQPDKPAVDLAIHGHVHMREDIVVGRTRVVVNARGYARPGLMVPEFEPQLILEI